jgi:hypothetical protein
MDSDVDIQIVETAKHPENIKNGTCVQKGIRKDFMDDPRAP